MKPAPPVMKTFLPSSIGGRLAWARGTRSRRAVALRAATPDRARGAGRDGGAARGRDVLRLAPAGARHLGGVRAHPPPRGRRRVVPGAAEGRGAAAEPRGAAE